MTDKPDAKDDNRLRSYCLKYQVLNQENEESAYFLGDPEDGTKVAKMFQFGSLVAETVAKETAELLTVTDNYYKTQNNGSPTVSFLLFLIIYCFAN